MSVKKNDELITSSSIPSLSTIYIDNISCLIICKLTEYEEICFNIVSGDLKVKLLFGNLKINEFNLEENKLVELYADKDNHLFCNLNFDLKFNLINFKKFLVKQQFNRFVQKEITRLNFTTSNASYMVLYAERNQDPLYLKYCYLIGRNVELNNWIKLEQKEQIILKDEWKECLVDKLENQLNQQMKNKKPNSQIVMVCGGKNSGKSTLIRNLINRQLNLKKDRKIYYLDLDPGQSEFTNSGQISFVEVNKPILFPTYINVAKFKEQVIYSCSVFSTNVEDLGALYSENLANLWLKIQQFIKPNDLIFVNTMGFVRIIGFMMLVDAIKLIRPTYLVEIKFQIPERVKNVYDVNYSIDLTDKNVVSTKGWLEFDLDRLRLRYTYLKLNHEFGLFGVIKNSKIKRINSQIVYLSLIESLLERPFNHLEPYGIKFKDVKIYLQIENQPEERLILDVLNCSWIQLCKIENEQLNDCLTQQTKSTNDNFKIIRTLGSNRCLGNGFIRNIDIKNKLFYIITSENLETVKQVNCIVKPNSINVPKEVLIPQLIYSKVQPVYIDVNF